MDLPETIARAQQALAEYMLTDLEIAHTFLDVAATTTDRNHAMHGIENAIIALRTVNKFLASAQSDSVNVDVLQARRDEVAERLRAVTGVDHSSFLSVNSIGPIGSRLQVHK